MKNALKAKRIAAKLTLKEVSKACDISCAALHGLENGRSDPKLKTAYKLAGFFDIPVTEIWPNDFKYTTKTIQVEIRYMNKS